MQKVLVVFGTRPETIKMAPVILELRRRPDVRTIVCVTGQHRDMLDDALKVFGIVPDHDLNIMRPGQTLAGMTSAILSQLTPVIEEVRPSRVLVHGDTTTTYAASVASFYLGTPVGHVEAGLRTGNMMAPWPEEFNRRSVDMFADLLWAPTERSARTLLDEGSPSANVLVTGNTVVDAILLVTDKIRRDDALRARLWEGLPRLDPAKKLVLVTGHRRESFGGGLAEMCEALNQLAAREEIEIVWPVHPNPNVVATVRERLSRRSNIHLTAPMEYLAFAALMLKANFIISDSGGIQEEAPTLNIPVLVTRNETERPEAVSAGTAKLVGTSAGRILGAAYELLDDPAVYKKMAESPNPFGDGRAAVRIVDSLIARDRAA